MELRVRSNSVFIALSFFLSINAFGSQIKDWSCALNSKSSATCKIAISGAIESDEYLFLINVSDVDEARSDGTILGKTGVIGAFETGFRFYAQFMPRLYSLYSLRDNKEAIISLNVNSIFSDTVGLSKERSIVKIIKQRDVIRELTTHFWTPLLLFLLPFALLAAMPLKSVHRDVLSPWNIEKSSVVMHITGSLFALSMSKVPRAIIPSLLSPDIYYRIHVLTLALFTYALTASIGGWVTACNAKNRALLTAVLNKTLLSLCMLAVILPLQAWADITIKSIHTTVFLAQNTLVMIVIFCVPKIFWKKSFSTGLSTSRAVIFIYAMMPIALARDTVTYTFFHSSGTQYWIHYSVLAMLAVHLLAGIQHRRITFKANTFVAKLRDSLVTATSGQERFDKVCDWFGNVFAFVRVSVARIQGDQSELLATGGPLSKPPAQRQPKRQTSSLIESIKVSRKPLYFPNPLQLPPQLLDQGLANAFLMIPVVQADSVQAIISLMGPPNKSLSAEVVNILDRATNSVQLELLSALSEHQENRRSLELKNIVRITSGIITEYLDDSGTFIGDGAISKRVVISADLVKSTRAAQHAKEFTTFKLLYDQALSEVYNDWIDARNVAGFKSKDPRGDDFWALSESVINFDSDILRRGLALAGKLEQIAREVFIKPEYRCLDIPGAHVALVLGNVTMRIRGQGHSQSIDTHSEDMSVCAKLRSLSQPGSILIEASDTVFLKLLENERDLEKLIMQAVNSEDFSDVFSICPKVFRIRIIDILSKKSA